MKELKCDIPVANMLAHTFGAACPPGLATAWLSMGSAA